MSLEPSQFSKTFPEGNARKLEYNFYRFGHADVTKIRSRAVRALHAILVPSVRAVLKL